MRKKIPIKQTNKGLFLALQADAKEFVGTKKNGISGLADALFVNETTLANQINPNNDTSPPTFTTIIEIIKLTQGKRTMFALAQLVDQVPMDLVLEEETDSQRQVVVFLNLVTRASNLLSAGSDAASDLRFDAQEKKDLLPLLLELMQVSALLYKSFNE